MRNELLKAFFLWAGSNVMPTAYGYLEGAGPIYDYEFPAKRILILFQKDAVIGQSREGAKSKTIHFQSVEDLVEMLEWATS